MKHLILSALVAVTFCNMAPQVLAQSAAAQDYQITIDSRNTPKNPVLYGLVGATGTTTGIKPVPNSTVKVVFTNLDTLLYDVSVKFNRTALTPPAATGSGNNPFQPSTGKAAAGFGVTALAQAQTLQNFATLGTTLVQKLVSDDSSYQKNGTKYPDVVAVATTEVSDVIQAADSSYKQGQNLTGDDIKKVGSAYLATLDVDKLLKDPFVENDLVLPAFLKKIQADPAVYYNALSQAAKIYDDIRALKENKDGELIYEFPTTAPVNNNEELVITVSISPRTDVDGLSLKDTKDADGHSLFSDLTELPDTNVLDVSNNQPSKSNLYYSVFFSNKRSHNYVSKSVTTNGVTSNVVAESGARDETDVTVGTLYFFPGTKNKNSGPSIGIGTNGTRLGYFGGWSLRFGKGSTGLLTLGGAVTQVSDLGWSQGWGYSFHKQFRCGNDHDHKRCADKGCV